MSAPQVVAVTGAGGYVGGRLVEALRAAGEVPRPLVGRRRSWLPADQVEVDLHASPPTALASALEGADAVVHLAGGSEVAADPAHALATTVAAAHRVGEAAREAGVRRLVHLSTVHVYGDRSVPGATLTEDLRPEPRHPYAVARLASEHVLAGACGGTVELVVLRLTNSVGAPAHRDVDRWTLVVNDLCRQAVTSGRLELRTSGVQWRDFVDLGDACGAIRQAAGALTPGTYNLGRGEPVTIRAVAGMVADAAEALTGRRPELHAPPPEADPPGPATVSVDRLAREGFRASTPVQASIEETVRFCLDDGGPGDG